MPDPLKRRLLPSKPGPLRALVLVALLTPAATLANAFELVGPTPRAVGMAGALTVLADDYAAAFYNPAGIAGAPLGSIGVGLSVLSSQAQVQALSSAPELDCTACRPPRHLGVQLGLHVPFSGKLAGRAALALMAQFPQSPILRVRAFDPKRPFWYHLGSDPDRSIGYLGVGVRLSPAWRVGLGLQILGDFVGEGIEAGVDAFSREITFREVNQHLSLSLSPTAGVTWAVTDKLNLSLAFRAEMRLRYHFPAQFALSEVAAFALVVSGYGHYSPHTAVLGASYAVDPRLTLTAESAFAWWRRAPSPYAQIDLDLTGDMLVALGLDQAFDASSPRTPPGFSNTLDLRVAAERRVGEALRVRTGLAYRPTPVPRQDVPGTNILDASSLVWGLGASLSVRDPFELFAEPVQFDAAAQLSHLLPREALKDQDDEVPSYRYSAWVVAAMIGLKMHF